MLSQIIQRSWYQPIGIVTVILLPVSVLFCVLATLRIWLYRIGILRQTNLPVPVIVVGNISVGGTGKTPLVIGIAEHLKSLGYKPGIVSRGYGGNAQSWPQAVTAESSPVEVGDEALLIANRCNCPMSVGPNRVQAAKKLLEDGQCDIIISDDGLQHLALGRDIEVVVIDGERRFGNGFCLPAGPLRELPSRTNQVDLLVSNGNARTGEYEMQLVPDNFESVSPNDQKRSFSEFSNKQVHAVAGIGNNERFFKALEDMSLILKRHAFDDHYAYQVNDLNFNDDLPVIMTEKDAVKCFRYSNDNTWYLPVSIRLPDNFETQFIDLLKSTPKVK